jgi:hypothetical protein
MSASHTEYPWNIRIDVGGVTFVGPGMESEEEAEAIKRIVDASGNAESAEVFKQ